MIYINRGLINILIIIITNSDSENNSIFTNNVVNSSVGEHPVNLSYFLNNEGANIYVTWY